jgi:DNA helicase-2/ATP-dependent DNA helicase PcrA
VQKDTNLLTNLNPKQREAVETIEGPVLVVAGPGTGKTQILATRIAHILEQTDINPRNILCLTFTEAGVRAMRQRLQTLIGTEAYYVPIHTFHSFSNEIIQTFPDKFPQLSGSPVRLDDIQRIKLVKGILDDFESLGVGSTNLIPLYNKYQYLRDILSAIQQLKREGVSPEDMSKLSKEILDELKASPKLFKGNPTGEYMRSLRVAERNVELAAIYARYQKLLVEAGYYDYEDMILFVIEQLERDDELLSFIQEQYIYILVDEYQDTNGSQNKLIQMLGSFGAEPNIFAVGDDDQAIYRFQGANVENLLSFTKYFPKAKVISVDTNYRSNQAILDAAQSSIKHNQNRLVELIPDLSKNLKAGLELAKHKPLSYQFANGQAELNFIIKKIRELHASGVAYTDIAVLYRKHADAEDVIDALLHGEVPINVIRGSNALDELRVRQLVKILKLIGGWEPEGERDLWEMLHYDFLQAKFNYSPVDIYQVAQAVDKYNWRQPDRSKRIELLNILVDPDKYRDVVDSVKGHLDRLQEISTQILRWRSLSSNTTLPDLISNVIQDSGLLSVLFDGDTDVDQVNAINSFFTFVKERYHLDREIKLKELLADMHTLEENNLGVPEQQLETDSDSVHLSTAHGAKGLEFQHVFIIKCYKGNWGDKVQRDIIKLPAELVGEPVDKEEKKDLAQEDERRLFFVALTRAKQQVYISSAQEYISGTDVKETEQSRFILEIDTELLQEGSTGEYEELDPQLAQQLLAPVTVKPAADEESKFLRGILTDFRLSASAMNEFLECPLKFKFNRLLRIPMPANEAVSLGNSIHKALELNAYKAMEEGGWDKKMALRDFETALRREYLGGDQFVRVLAEGKDTLSKYFDFYKDDFAMPAAVEYNFGKHNVILELPASEPVVLSGKIDKLEWVSEKDLRIKIVDYKVSSPKTENFIRGGTKEQNKNIWRQLAFYVLMAQLDDNFKPRNKMQKYMLDHVEVDFVKNVDEKFKKVSLEISTEDISSLKNEISEVITAIRNLEFHGTDKYPLCGECEFCTLLS